MKNIFIVCGLLLLASCSKFYDQKVILDCKQNKLVVPPCLKNTAALKQQAAQEDKVYQK